jgi:type IV secretion system protein VirB3
MTPGLDRDTVFGALTRPQMFAGVTYSFFIANAVLTVEAFLITRSFLALLLAPVLHVIGSIACIREPRIFDIWLVRLSRCPRVRNARFWGCNSYTP